MHFDFENHFTQKHLPINYKNHLIILSILQSENMSPLRWGILSAGLISHDFLAGFAHLPKDEHKVIAVAARSLENAEKLAKVHNVPKSYGSYEELVKDPEIGMQNN